MSPTGPIRVTGKDGWRGTIEAQSRPVLGSDQLVSVLLDDGREIQVRGTALEPQPDGSYFLPISLEDATRQQEVLRVPIVEEQLQVEKREVEGGRVRIHKTVHEEDATVDEPVWQEEVDVQRVPVGRLIDSPVTARYEGDTLIVPVMEEVLVVEKRLMLKEELRITKQRTEVHQVEHHTLRKEDATVERLDSSGATAAPQGRNLQENDPK